MYHMLNSLSCAIEIFNKRYGHHVDLWMKRNNGVWIAGIYILCSCSIVAFDFILLARCTSCFVQDLFCTRENKVSVFCTFVRKHCCSHDKWSNKCHLLTNTTGYLGLHQAITLPLCHGGDHSSSGICGMLPSHDTPHCPGTLECK